jgi:hypothetical protein
MTSGKNCGKHLVSFELALKHTLRNTSNFDVVEGFLNELIKQQFKIIDILENPDNEENPANKSGYVDILVKDDTNEVILIEILFVYDNDYYEKALCYDSIDLVNRAVRNDKSNMAKYTVETYAIFIKHIEDKEKTYCYHGTMSITDMITKQPVQLTKKQYRNLLQLTGLYAYPQHYIIALNNFGDTVNNTLDEWIYFLKHDKIEDSFSAQGLVKARDLLDYSKLPENEKANYDRHNAEKN